MAFLIGKKAICGFVGRSWSTVENWILYQDFPAKMINGVWESDADLITEWRKRKIMAPIQPEKLVKSRGKHRKTQKVKTQ